VTLLVGWLAEDRVTVNSLPILQSLHPETPYRHCLYKPTAAMHKVSHSETQAKLDK